jgi:alanyl-tRNA synthetase
MCGIAGFVESSSASHPLKPADARALAHRMCDVIRHRGPDDEGVWVDEGVALGMRRLSIIDLSTGHQPIHNEDRSVWIVFNGEVYNFQELRRELEAVRKEARRPKADATADFTIVERESDVVLVEAKGAKGGQLRDLSDRLRQQEGAAGVIVGSVDDGRAYLVVNPDDSLVGKGLDAVQLVRELGRHIGGGGGGRPTLAEAGGKNPAGLRDALEAGKQAIAAALK